MSTIDKLLHIPQVLYCKRDDPMEEFKLPEHLKHHARRPLVSHPQEVIDKVPMSLEAFSCFLQQSYAGFFGKMVDLAQASDALSIGDSFFNEWTVILSL